MSKMLIVLLVISAFFASTVPVFAQADPPVMSGDDDPVIGPTEEETEIEPPTDDPEAAPRVDDPRVVSGDSGDSVNDDPSLETNRRPVVNFKGCIYYEHSEFRGANMAIKQGVITYYVGGAWNDKISSIACHPSCSVMVYEHRDFQGASDLFGDWTHYVGGKWNDRASSLVAVCRA